jgi:WD40 repeat protein
VFSCSNDTTIKLWSTQGLSEQEGPPKSVKSLLTLNDDYDYIRAIDFCQMKSTLFSAADNGIVRQWDIIEGKQVSQFDQVSFPSHL